MFKKLFSAFRADQGESQPQPAPRDNSLARLRAIREMLWDRTAVFSISQTEAELNEIENALDEAANNDREAQGEIAYARGYLATRKGDYESQVAEYRTALLAHREIPFLNDQQKISAKFGLASAHEALGDWAEAIQAYQDVIPEMERSEFYDDDQLGGTLEKLAYCQHEAGQYEDALATNLRSIELAKGFLPEGSPYYMTVFTNTAQNLYQLQRGEEAKPYLENVLQIARANDIAEKVVEMEFQLGVLAFENGQYDSAKAHMEASLEYAQSTGDEGLISYAQGNLDALYDRLGEANNAK